ncbi:MAG TPA: prepilin-type N-terminal cleavage/methylation domain-containing protein [Candidatus Paceibacterota bacterium]|nr:prepilin-type N-terminal cleavage/methylation domain-containing protein [Candidatus Paceibacterota bacterium]
MNMYSSKRKTSGFTVVELLVSLFIVSMVVVVLALFQTETFKKDRAFRARLVSIQEARLTLRRFLEETRSASPSSTGAYPISLAQADAFTLYSDVDGDAIKDRVRYFVSGGSLKKGVLKPTGSPLVYNQANERVFTQITKLATTTNIFTYYDTNNATMTQPVSPSLVRSARINLVVALDSQYGATTTVLFETRGTFRNLKDNY